MTISICSLYFQGLDLPSGSGRVLPLLAEPPHAHHSDTTSGGHHHQYHQNIVFSHFRHGDKQTNKETTNKPGDPLQAYSGPVKRQSFAIAIFLLLHHYNNLFSFPD